MKVSVKSVEVLRIRDTGETVICRAYIREPERDPLNPKRYLIDKATGMYQFAETSQLRTRMLVSGLKTDVIIDIPKQLLNEIRDAFFDYAEHYRLRSDRAFTSIINDVTGTHDDENYPVGRKRMALLYLRAYRFLRDYERAEFNSHELPDDDEDDEACYG